MSTCYVIFNEDTTVTTTDTVPSDSENYTYIKTQDSDQGPIQYYAHNTLAALYKEALINRVLV